MHRFDNSVRTIESEANSFIDDSFKSLRSAEGAFDMLHNFKHIRGRAAINTTMMMKFEEILAQYSKEVGQQYYVCTYVHTVFVCLEAGSHLEARIQLDYS